MKQFQRDCTVNRALTSFNTLRTQCNKLSCNSTSITVISIVDKPAARCAALVPLSAPRIYIDSAAMTLERALRACRVSK